MKRWSLAASFVLFVALCASAAYWGLQWFKPAARPVAAPPSAAPAELKLDAAAGLFGGRPAAVAVTSNFQLKGVVVARNARESVAILVADGKPAQAAAVDAEFMPGVSVREVHSDYVLLSEGGVTKRVELAQGGKPQVRMELAANVPAAPAAQVVTPTVIGNQMPPPQATIPGTMPPPGPANRNGSEYPGARDN